MSSNDSLVMSKKMNNICKFVFLKKDLQISLKPRS